MNYNYEFRVNIGDWSNDGHEKCDKFIISSNISVEEAQEHYIQRVKKYIEEFPKQTIFDYNNEMMICREHEDSIITEQQFNDLVKLGIDLSDNFIDYENTFESLSDGNSGIHIESVDMVYILMSIVQLNCEDFKWEIKPDDTLNFNGYWGKINTSFGYGLFW